MYIKVFLKLKNTERFSFIWKFLSLCKRIYASFTCIINFFKYQTVAERNVLENDPL